MQDQTRAEPTAGQYTEDDKRRWEIEKLQAETRNLSRPYLRQPASWIPIGTLIISIVANAVQYSSAERQRQLAQIQKESLELQTKKLEDKRRELQISIDSATGALNSTQQQAKVARDQLASIQADISQARLTQDVRSKISELQETVASIDRTADSANVAFQGSSSLQEARKLELQGFQSLLNGDFDAALRSFGASESAVNGYHWSYEWERLLRINKSLFSDPQKRKTILKEALHNRYDAFAPREIREQLKAAAI